MTDFFNDHQGHSRKMMEEGQGLLLKDPNRELHELLGKEPEKIPFGTAYPVTVDKFPDYTDARLVLEAIKEMDNWGEFLLDNGAISKHGRHLDCILVDLILDRTGKLRDLAIQWLKGQKGQKGEKG